MIVPLTPLEFRQRAVLFYGSKVGIVDGEKRFTYAEFDGRINRFANALDLNVLAFNWQHGITQAASGKAGRGHASRRPAADTDLPDDVSKDASATMPSGTGN